MLYSSFKLVFNPLITLIVFYVTLVVKSRYKIMDNFHSIHYLRCNDFWILALEAGSLSRNPMLQLTFCYFGRQLVSLAPVVFSDNYFHNCICHAGLWWELLEIRYLKAVRIRYLVSTQWMTLDSRWLWIAGHLEAGERDCWSVHGPCCCAACSVSQSTESENKSAGKEAQVAMYLTSVYTQSFSIFSFPSLGLLCGDSWGFFFFFFKSSSML